MKLPVIKHLQRNTSVTELESALAVLEAVSDHRSTKDNDLDVYGELITNICGALEVHQMIQGGKTETEAANAFAQKVMGSIDR